MSEQFDFDMLPKFDILFDMADEQDISVANDDFYLIENDFNRQSDDRVWKSNIEDIDGGDNFADYCEYFFEILDEEEYYND